MITQTTPVSEAPFALPKILTESTRSANGSSDTRQAAATEQVRTVRRHGRTFTVDGFRNEWEAVRRMRALLLWHHNLIADASLRPHRTQVRGGPARRPSVRRRAARGGASRSSPDDGAGEPDPAAERHWIGVIGELRGGLRAAILRRWPDAYIALLTNVGRRCRCPYCCSLTAEQDNAVHEQVVREAVALLDALIIARPAGSEALDYMHQAYRTGRPVLRYKSGRLERIAMERVS